ncbi:MAG: bifunctional 5,10-methylenetetrahydrofolate dehydrogenase/5,10-methenyltetrahydrofolate cyclohydrolase [Elusimicrobia bacterium]|nr:bifunctional 5,10-methylenetetrahydrofolate dehydrogenase/5,10-methenyltetrahydrofolate cyclohydrolase [Elusimicrobiota bacterium]
MIKTQIIDGKALALAIRQKLKEDIRKLGAQTKPGLATVLVGDDPASAVYVRNKIAACKETGIETIDHKLGAATGENELLDLLQRLGGDRRVHGILVQMPLPPQMRASKILEAMPEEKDADGFGVKNWGRLYQAKSLTELENCFIPCTPLGILKMLEAYRVNPEGKMACVIGRSNIVGKPMAHLLTLHNATVTVCHSKTKKLAEITRRADILIAAIGRPRFVTKEMVKEGACVIDVGINRMNDERLVGDCDFEGLSQRSGLITPVPGGVGPMTIAMLLANTIKAWKRTLNSRSTSDTRIEK